MSEQEVVQEVADDVVICTSGGDDTVGSSITDNSGQSLTSPSPSTITAPPLKLAVDMGSHGGADQKLARAPPSVDENWFRVHHLFLIASRELQGPPQPQIFWGLHSL